MKIVDYLLNIRGRNYAETFQSKEELVAELKYRGLPTTLADFDGRKPDKYGMATNHYQNVSVTAYDESAFTRRV